jgi:hypothetical protein
MVPELLNRFGADGLELAGLQDHRNGGEWALLLGGGPAAHGVYRGPRLGAQPSKHRCSRDGRIPPPSVPGRGPVACGAAVVKSAWQAYSLPWSQVMLRVSSAGSVLMASRIAYSTRCASRPAGRCSSSTNRLVRSTRVPTADFRLPPMSRSPSQWPGSARSSASLRVR